MNFLLFEKKVQMNIKKNLNFFLEYAKINLYKMNFQL